MAAADDLTNATIIGETTTTTHHVDGSQEVVKVTELCNPDGTITKRTTTTRIPAAAAHTAAPAVTLPGAVASTLPDTIASSKLAQDAAEDKEDKEDGFYEFLGYLENNGSGPKILEESKVTRHIGPEPATTPVPIVAPVVAEPKPLSLAPAETAIAPNDDDADAEPPILPDGDYLPQDIEEGCETAPPDPIDQGSENVQTSGSCQLQDTQGQEDKVASSLPPFWTRNRKIGAATAALIVLLIALVATIGGVLGSNKNNSSSSKEDLNSSTDPIIPTGSVPIKENCTQFVLTMELDLFPTETMFQLLNVSKDSNETVVLSRGPYESDHQAQVVTAGACLLDGSYELVVKDAKGDGMCCDMGDGKYGVILGEKVLREFGPAIFTSEDVVEFHVGEDQQTTESPTMLPTSKPTLQTASPTVSPSSFPTIKPTGSPTTTSPTTKPTTQPTTSRPTPITGPCYDVRIFIATDINTGGALGDVTTWELQEKSSGETKISGGPLGPNRTYTNDICLPASTYVFNITDSGNNGFGNPDHCGERGCGYNIFVGDNLVGWSIIFSTNEEFTFPVPYDEEESCSSDLWVEMATDSYPEETKWEVVNEAGVTVLNGGPYNKPQAFYSQIACLDDGEYQFTIYDSLSDGLDNPGFYILSSGGETFADSRDDLFGFSSSKSISFVVSDKTVTSKPINKPTSRPTTKNPTVFLTQTPPVSPPITTSSVCSFCSDGVDFPDWVVGSSDGQPTTCQMIKGWSSLDVLESSELCDHYQLFEADCCEEGDGPVCSFCPGGLILSGLFSGQIEVGEVDGEPVTCQWVKDQSLGFFEGSTLCDSFQESQASCCPGDDTIGSAGSSTPKPTEAGNGPGCSFCSGGVDFPDLAAGSVNGKPVTCQEIKEVSLSVFDGSTLCENYQSFEEDCCEAGSGPVCSFCPNGVMFPDYVAETIEDDSYTCEDLDGYSLGMFESSDICLYTQIYETVCCPSGGSS